MSIFVLQRFLCCKVVLICYNRSPKTKLIIVAPHLGAHTDPLMSQNRPKVHIETVWKTIEFCILGNDIHSKKKKFKFFILI